jgi:hypothetical protein
MSSSSPIPLQCDAALQTTDTLEAYAQNNDCIVVPKVIAIMEKQNHILLYAKVSQTVEKAANSKR